MAAQGVHLLDRRRQRGRAPVRRTGRSPSCEQKAEGLKRVAAAVHGAARAARHQPADGPVRAGRGGARDGLPALVHGPHVRRSRPPGRYVGQWLQSFKEFPPRQKPGSFNLDRVMEAVMCNLEAVTGRPDGDRYLPRRAAPAVVAGAALRRSDGARLMTRNLNIAAGLVLLLASLPLGRPNRCRRGTTAHARNGHRLVRRARHDRGRAGLRAAGRAHRRIRQRRHALERAADVRAARLLASTA